MGFDSVLKCRAPQFYRSGQRPWVLPVLPVLPALPVEPGPFPENPATFRGPQMVLPVLPAVTDAIKKHSVPEETKTETEPFPPMRNWKPLNPLKKGFDKLDHKCPTYAKGLPLQEMARLLREPTNPKPGFFVFIQQKSRARVFHRPIESPKSVELF